MVAIFSVKLGFIYSLIGDNGDMKAERNDARLSLSFLGSFGVLLAEKIFSDGSRAERQPIPTGYVFVSFCDFSLETDLNTAIRYSEVQKLIV